MNRSLNLESPEDWDECDSSQERRANPGTGKLSGLSIAKSDKKARQRQPITEEIHA